jgi:hypothetical protein
MKSKSKILLRTACVLIFVHLAGHFIGHTGWQRPTDPKMQEVVNAMVENKANYMGAVRSLADFYHGYSVLLFIVYGLSIWALWILSSRDKKDSQLIIPFGVAYLAIGAVEFWLFFPFATIISTLAGVAIVLSLFFNDNKPYKKDIKNENRKDY